MQIQAHLAKMRSEKLTKYVLLKKAGHIQITGSPNRPLSDKTTCSESSG